MNTFPTLMWRMICVTLTTSQAIQQSHFLRAYRSCAVRIRTVTQQSR